MVHCDTRRRFKKSHISFKIPQFPSAMLNVFFCVFFLCVCSYIISALCHGASLTILGVFNCQSPCSGSRRPRHAPLLLTGRRALVLPRFKVLDGLSVLVIDQGHGDHCIPAILLPGTPEIDLLIVCGYDGEIDELAGALHAVHLLDGLQLELLALRALLRVGVNVEAVRGQDARLPLPELKQVVAPLLQLSFLQDLADLLR